MQTTKERWNEAKQRHSTIKQIDCLPSLLCRLLDKIMSQQHSKTGTFLFVKKNRDISCSFIKIRLERTFAKRYTWLHCCGILKKDSSEWKDVCSSRHAGARSRSWRIRERIQPCHIHVVQKLCDFRAIIGHSCRNSKKNFLGNHLSLKMPLNLFLNSYLHSHFIKHV